MNRLNVLLLALALAAGSLACQRHARTAPTTKESAPADTVPVIVQEEVTGMGLPIWPGYRLGGVTRNRTLNKPLAVLEAEWAYAAAQAAAKEEAIARTTIRAIGLPALVLGLIGLVLGAYLSLKSSTAGEDLLILGALTAGAGGTLMLYPRQAVWVLGGLVAGTLAYAVCKRLRQRQATAVATDLIHGVDKIRKVVGNDIWKGRIAPVLADQQAPTRALVARVQKAGQP